MNSGNLRESQEDEMAEFIGSQKDQRKLNFGGFIFARNKSDADNKEIWLCHNTGCRARVHTLQNNIITYVGEHNHSLLHGDRDVHVIRSAIKRRAVQGEERSRQVSGIWVK